MSENKATKIVQAETLEAMAPGEGWDNLGTLAFNPKSQQIVFLWKGESLVRQEFAVWTLGYKLAAGVFFHRVKGTTACVWTEDGAKFQNEITNVLGVDFDKDDFVKLPALGRPV